MTYDLSAERTVSFVVPCYNERENVAKTIEEIEAAAGESGTGAYEILVVDDCSKDGTGDLVAALMQEKRHVKLISNTQNLGFGGAYKEGLKRAAATHVIMVPGDGVPRAGIIPILRKMGQADIVVPYVGNPEVRPWQRRFASRAFTFVINTLFGLNVPYFNGLVLHKTKQLRRIDIKTNGFAYQAEALVKLISGGASYCTVSMIIEERRIGKSSAFSLKNVYRVAKAVFLLWYETRHRALGRARHPVGDPNPGRLESPARANRIE